MRKKSIISILVVVFISMLSCTDCFAADLVVFHADFDSDSIDSAPSKVYGLGTEALTASDVAVKNQDGEICADILRSKHMTAVFDEQITKGVFCVQFDTWQSAYGPLFCCLLNTDAYNVIRVDEHGTPIIDRIKDNTVIYIGKNAVVNAAIELVGVKNVKILGTGIISLIDRCDGAAGNFEGERFWGSFRYYAKSNILIRSGSENVEIDGVLLNCEFRGIVTRNCENIVIKNVKIFSSTENADGINCYNTSDMLVDNCYIQSADDCFCMYNSCDSIPTLFDEGYDDVKAICKNVEVKNCLMSSNARPVVLGGHATGETKPRCIIENIYMHDCEVVSTPYRIFGNTEEYSMYWSGILRILSQSEQIVRKLRFDNITVNVTSGHNGNPFHLEVRDSKNASYTENAGYRIEDVIFSNINFNGDTSKMLKSLLKCRPAKTGVDNPCIENIAFKNICIGGQKLKSDMLVSEGLVCGISIE